MKNEPSLEQELIMAGADPEEARELNEFAGRLPMMRQLPQLPPGLEHGHREMRRRATSRRSFAFASYATAMVAVVVLAGGSLAAAQSALPGDALYSLKRSSENLAATFQPAQHDQIMMNRATEIDQLVAHHRNPTLIHATLASYDGEVKQTPGSYAAREYCSNMLRAAATHADPTTRSEIMQSLSHIQIDHS
jgi:hypothetical protein